MSFPSTPWLAIALASLLFPIASITFGKGFLPFKPLLSGFATYAHDYESPPAPFDKVVFMVIDALRSDFVYASNSSFTFTQSLVSTGSAIPFTAYASSPTITLPRVKAITTGSIPGFLDVILNFAESDEVTSLSEQDSWPAQLKARGGLLVMYGDDTWLNLFPGMFTRADGTSSFFVSDFFEVDNNVTRHIDEELEREDWSGLVMHYLGLDHIGHKAGPRSVFMRPKQAEMDNIVKRIYMAMEEKSHLQSTLFVLAGDHGMNDAGNHGGSSPGETSPALLFISPKLERLVSNGRQCPTEPKPNTDFNYYTVVEQSDIAPTLAGLLGFPVPKNNLGVFIPEFLELWTISDQVELIRQNAAQLEALVAAAHPEYLRTTIINNCEHAPSNVDELSCWRAKAEEAYHIYTANHGVSADSVLELFLRFSHRCQHILSMAASNYDIAIMYLGMTIMLAMISLCAVPLVPILARQRSGRITYILVTLSYGLMMFASSYVEEEQHFWYWLSSGFCILLFIDSRRCGFNGSKFLLLLSLLRLARRWNQTGQKHAGAPDIAKHFFPAHTTLLWCLIIITYTELFISLSKHSFRQTGRRAAWGLSFTAITSAAAFKLSYAAHDAIEMVPQWLTPFVGMLEEIPLVNQARAVFGLLFCAGVCSCLLETCENNSAGSTFSSAAVFHDIITIFLLTQTRFVNIPLFLLFRMVLAILTSSSSVSPMEQSLLVLLLQHFSFYAIGNANAISSVDLSNSYNGVSAYSVVLVGLLTFASNWAGPIFWASAAPLLLSGRVDKPGETERARKSEGLQAQQLNNAWLTHSLMMVFWQGTAALSVMMACTTMRTHLFIWTVFSPKYLYQMVWSCVFQTLVNAGWGGCMWQLGGNKHDNKR